MTKKPEFRKATVQEVAQAGGVVNMAALLANPDQAATEQNTPIETPAIAEAKSEVQTLTDTAAANAIDTPVNAADLIPQLNTNVAPVVIDTGAQVQNKPFTNRNNPGTAGNVRQPPARASFTAAAPVIDGSVGSNGNIIRQSPLLARTLAAREAAKAAAIELTDSLDRILKDVPPANQSEIIRIRQYCVAMGPGRVISEEQGAQQQVALYRSLQTIINRQTAYFTPLFTAVLKIFQVESIGALSDTHRNRFDSHVTLSKEDRRAFRSITHLLSIVADPKGRALALRSVDLEAALANGLTDDGRNRVINHLT